MTDKVYFTIETPYLNSLETQLGRQKHWIEKMEKRLDGIERELARQNNLCKAIQEHLSEQRQANHDAP